MNFWFLYLLFFLFSTLKFTTVAKAMLENFALIKEKRTASKFLKTYLF